MGLKNEILTLNRLGTFKPTSSTADSKFISSAWAMQMYGCVCVGMEC